MSGVESKISGEVECDSFGSAAVGERDGLDEAKGG